MGRKHTEKSKEKISEAMKKHYKNPRAWKTHSRAMKKRYSNSLERKKTSIAMKKYYSNPKAVKRLSRIIKNAYKKNPNLAEKVDKAITKWWKEHPNIRKEMSIRAKNLFMKNPSKFAKFLKYGKNPASPRFKTKQGFKVRSRGEQTIANFLHDNNIPSQYETKTLIFKEEGQICVPDFYLPSSHSPNSPHHKGIYIEFYGGHPKAWKKKVMKNRLYKLHKIPCIFITPGELGDLRKWLLGELEGKGNGV